MFGCAIDVMPHSFNCWIERNLLLRACPVLEKCDPIANGPPVGQLACEKVGGSDTRKLPKLAIHVRLVAVATLIGNLGPVLWIFPQAATRRAAPASAQTAASRATSRHHRAPRASAGADRASESRAKR